MLVVHRKLGEAVIIHPVTVRVLELRGKTTKLGIEAPKYVSVHREEIYQQIQTQHSDIKCLIEDHKAKPHISLQQCLKQSESANDPFFLWYTDYGPKHCIWTNTKIGEFKIIGVNGELYVENVIEYNFDCTRG